MENNNEIKDTIFNFEPLTPLFSHPKQFESHESWQWLIDGYPPGQEQIIRGIIDGTRETEKT